MANKKKLYLYFKRFFRFKSQGWWGNLHIIKKRQGGFSKKITCVDAELQIYAILILRINPSSYTLEKVKCNIKCLLVLLSRHIMYVSFQKAFWPRWKAHVDLQVGHIYVQSV